MSDPSRILNLLERLILEALPNTPPILDKTLQDYLKYFQRILTSRLTVQDLDENALKTLIIQRVFSVSPDNSAHKQLRFQELLQKLSRNRVLFHKDAILYLLYKLANSAKLAKTNVSPLESLFRDQENPTKVAKSTEKPAKTAMEIEKPATFALQTIRKVCNKGNDAINLSETDILRDLLYVFHAIDGHYMSFSAVDGSFAIKPGVPLPEPVRNLINSLCELGFLYKKLSVSLNKPRNGLISQALALGVKEELNEYFKLLAVLENLRVDGENSQGNSQGNGLSLRKLSLWVLEPLERMKWLNILSESAGELIGGDVLSSVYAYIRQGSPVIQQLVERILNFVSQPFLKYVHLWMYQGFLSDACGEFFVQELENPQCSDVWVHKYAMISGRVPSFIDKLTAERIFLAGKTVNFLKICCKVSDFSLIIEPFDAKELSVRGKFADWVQQCAGITSARLLETLFRDFSLEGHFTFLKKYLLMGQGDFIQALMDNLTNELNNPASQVFRHQLLGFLETAARSSNAQYQNSEFLNRLEVKLLEPSPGDTGWDVFSLDYRVESPINTVFHAKIMRKYLQIFNFLWRVKRVEFCLHGVWVGHMKAAQSLQRFANVKRLFHKCHLLRNQMVHFVDNLCNYLMVEVIEATWTNFKEKVPLAKELNEIIEIHEQCIDQILEKALLKEKTENLYKSLLKIFEFIFRLKFTQEILISKANEIVAVIRQRQTEREIQEIVGENRNFRVDSEGLGNFAEENAKIVDTLAKDYMQALFQFQNLLRKEDSLGNLKFLSFRLDFNEFYNNQPNNKFSDMGNIFPAPSIHSVGPEKFSYNISNNFNNFNNLGNKNNNNNNNIGNFNNKNDFNLNIMEKNSEKIIKTNENPKNTLDLQNTKNYTKFLQFQTGNFKPNQETSMNFTNVQQKNENIGQKQQQPQVIESIFKHDMEEEDDEFLQEGEDEEEQEFEDKSFEEHEEFSGFDPDKTNSFRK